MDNNYIDFPCSQDWLDYYAERGLTPYRSSRGSHEITQVWKEIQKITKKQEELQESLIQMIERITKTEESIALMLRILNNNLQEVIKRTSKPKKIKSDAKPQTTIDNNSIIEQLSE